MLLWAVRVCGVGVGLPLGTIVVVVLWGVIASPLPIVAGSLIFCCHCKELGWIQCVCIQDGVLVIAKLKQKDFTSKDWRKSVIDLKLLTI